MIANQLALIKREFWEHRAIYVTPIVIAIVVTLGVMAMLVFVSGFAKELNIAIFGAQNIAGEVERKAALTGFPEYVLVLSGRAGDPDGVLLSRLAVCGAQGQEHTFLALAADHGCGDRHIQARHGHSCHPPHRRCRHHRDTPGQPGGHERLGHVEGRQRAGLDLEVRAVA